MSEISITEDVDNGLIKIQRVDICLDVEIPTIDFAIITAIHLEQQIPITDICLCYQEQFNN